MRNTRKDVTTFGTDVIKKTERINKVSFRICKKPKYMIRVTSDDCSMITMRKLVSKTEVSYTCFIDYKDNDVTFRICKLPKPRKKKWYDNIRNYFNRWFSLANR